jgi:hypothetical protein
MVASLSANSKNQDVDSDPTMTHLPRWAEGFYCEFSSKSFVSTV